MKKSVKRILCGILSLTTLSSLALERALAGAKGETLGVSASAKATFENVTGQFDTSALREQYFANSVLKSESAEAKYETRTVMVTLKGKNVVERADGEAVTSFLETWQGDRAVAEIAKEQDSFLRALRKKGIPYELDGRYDAVLNGVSIVVDTSYVAEIKKMSGVESVVITTAYSEPKTAVSEGNAATNETNVYATGIYDSSEYAKEYGAGTVVAVLDTGLDYTHPAFQRFESDSAELAWTEDTVKNLLETKALTAEVRSGTLELADVYMSDKVPYAYDYADDDADVYPSYSNHGTHVAGIIGGYDTSGYTDKDGNPIAETFKGVAPDAQLAIFKVFTDDLDDPDLGGAVAEDIIAALDDCVKLGVDVINMSLGTSCGFTTTDDGDSEGEMLNAVYESIQEAGISLVCAASNDYSAGYGGVYGTNLATNPDSGTVGSPSTFASALSVASVNGQKASYMIANGGTASQAYVFYEESRDIDGNPFDFFNDLKTKYNKTEFEYVVVPGIGQAADYTATVRSLFKDGSGASLGRLALIKRGDSTFQEKVEIAMQMGAAGVIIYNNVAGVIRMNLGEIENPVPSVSINMNAGNAMVKGAVGRVGKVQLSEEQKAGPFMSEFSSWGPTHDLKLKPEITAHGGEITSTVPGGYGEQSGTSMASPNMAGFTALVRNYIKKDLSATVDGLVEYYTALERAKNPEAKAVSESVVVNRLAMQMMMSTATTAIDQDGLAYSPRKQGAGLARMERVIGGTNAYLWVGEENENGLISTAKSNDYRPKLELGDDENRTGVYEMSFNVTNFGAEALTFNVGQIIMTETLSSDKLTVSEQARMLDKAKTEWTLGGNAVSSVSVGAGETVTLSVKITLDESEKAYIEQSFANGMYVEGFLKLNSATGGQCDLSIPFLGFYGDWEDAPMLDYTAFEIAANEQDASVKEEDKIKASVFATQPYTSYYNEKFILPMGGYVYLLPDDAEPMYVSEEKCSVSRYNMYYGEGEAENYLTSTQIKAVYAGLLRNARVVKYKLYDEATGEMILEDECFRVGKAYAGGGQATPANVELELNPEVYDLAANGKYRMEFEFFMSTPEEGEKAKEENTYGFSFTVDYDAPVMEDARVRFYNYKDGSVEKQKIYLDVDVYDNHYAQALMVCYPTTNSSGEVSLMLATDYPTPIREAKPNGTTTVSIEITDIYEKYGSQLYVQIDDYAVNSCLYRVDIASANKNALPDSDGFTVKTDSRLTKNGKTYELNLDIYETYKVGLSYEGAGDTSNFIWEAFGDAVAVKNGEIVGLKTGTATVTVSNYEASPTYYDIRVTVSDKRSSKLPAVPSVSFGIIKTNQDALTKAKGVVKVNAGVEFTLPIETDPWYHPLTDIRFVWSSTDPSVATVDENGNVKTLKKGMAIVMATAERKNANGEWTQTLYSASVTLRVQNEFTVSNYTLTDYNGVGGVVVIPDDMNIWYIGEEAFKDNDNITKIVIPASVTQINERAFINCTALEEVYFVSEKHRLDENGDIIRYEGEEKEIIDWSDLSMIYEQAFYGCTKLKKVDLSNVKTATVAAYAFADCTSLQEIVEMPSIGTAHHFAFANTALESVDLTGLHMSGSYVFAGCKNLKHVTTGKFTAIGDYMFYGCTGLREQIVISTPKLGNNAFEDCINLSGVKFQSPAGEAISFAIGANAFKNCGKALIGTNFEADFNGETVRAIGDRAFAGSTLETLGALRGLESFGANVFANTKLQRIYIDNGTDIEKIRFLGVPFGGVTVELTAENSDRYTKENGALYNAEKTKIYYVDSTAVGTFALPNTVTEIGAYAFAGSNVTEITISENVTKLGEGAFENSALTKVVFAGTNLVSIPENAFRSTNLATVALPVSVTEIGAYAFADSALHTFACEGVTAIGEGAFANCIALRGEKENGSEQYVLTVPNSVKTLGARAFYGCSTLVSVKLPALKMGEYAFYGCTQLQEAELADGASELGEYAFAELNLTKVTLGEGLKEIPVGAFYGNKKLENITLPASVKTVKASAFQNSKLLADVEGIEGVETFGDYAFYGTALGTAGTLDLAGATHIGNYAFAKAERFLSGKTATGEGETQYPELKIPSVKTIGNFAFLYNGFKAVNLYENTEKIGYGAFAGLDNSWFAVEAGNTRFFADEGVLYRIAGEDVFELIAYPSARYGEDTETEGMVYTVKTGTARVEAYAFFALQEGRLDKAVLPYTVNSIGDAAFFNSGVKSYTFESIEAPILETVFRSEVMEIIEAISISRSESTYYKGYYNTNFETYLYEYTKFGGKTSDLKMFYPTNGIGYTNHIYRAYFGESKQTGVNPEDETRACLALIEEMPDASELATWLTWEKTEENKATVEGLSEKVKTARRYYNNASLKEEQKQFLTAEATEKLSAVEEILRDVKAYFGVAVKIAELRVAASTAHKSEYLAGETFDMTGLAVEIIYDDNSTELAEPAKVTLKTSNPLTKLTRFVVVSYGGKELRVAVTVKENEAEEDTPADSSDSSSEVVEGEKKGCGSALTSGFAGALAIVAVGVLTAKRKKERADE